MDHFPTSANIVPLDIVVPYLADQAQPYDGKGFQNFPESVGFGKPGQYGIALERLVGKSDDEIIAFVQSWLYFGLLKIVLGRRFDLRDFLCPDTKRPKTTQELRQRPRLVTTLRLPALIGRMSKDFVKKDRFGLVKYEATDAASKSAPDQIFFLCAYTHNQCVKLECTRSTLPQSWLDILLSIEVLTETLYGSRISWRFGSRKNRLSPWVHNPNGPLVRYAQSLIQRQRGWCAHQLRRASRTCPISALVYLATLQRRTQPWIDHEPCQYAKECGAYNIHSDMFPNVHVGAGCQCLMVAAPTQEMLGILRQGGIPVLRCTTTRRGELVLSFRKSSPKTSYIAVSYLWADGLHSSAGGPILRCQLEKIVGQVCSLRNIRYPTLGSIHVDIWIDVYCVPQLSTESCVRSSSEEERILFLIALSRMATTFAWATAVLVLDYELCLPANERPDLELYARLTISGWNSRYWTFQEYSLAKEVRVQTGREPVELRGDFFNYSSPAAQWFHEGFQGLAERRHVATGAKSRVDGQEFSKVWDQLCMRSVMDWGDSLHITATLLHKKAEEILVFDQMGQMQALLASQESLPLRILTTPAERHLYDLHGRRQTCIALVPNSTKGAEPVGRGSDLEVTPCGLLWPAPCNRDVLRQWAHFALWVDKPRTAPLPFNIVIHGLPTDAQHTRILSGRTHLTTQLRILPQRLEGGGMNGREDFCASLKGILVVDATEYSVASVSSPSARTGVYLIYLR
jgi:hypothetical protein